MTHAPETIPWPSAPARIASLLAGRRAVVGVTGPAGAGKSTLAGLVGDGTGGVVISTDEYLPDYDLVPEADRDLPEHADLPLLARHLRLLRSGEAADVPVWSFHEHKRVGSRRVEPAVTGVVIVEGLFALHRSLGDAVDLRVFVEADPSVRWARWEAIETRGERGMGVEAARAFFHTVADPTYARFAPAYREAADLIVTNNAGPGHESGSPPV